MKAGFIVVQNNDLQYSSQSIVVDNMVHSNAVHLYCITNWELLKNDHSIGRWKVKEGSLKIKYNGTI